MRPKVKHVKSNTVLDFIIIAFCIFMAVKQVNRSKKKAEPAVTTHEEVLLLRKI